MHDFPKNIFFYWCTKENIPNEFVENINVIKNNYNDFNVELLDDNKIIMNPEINEIFPDLLKYYNKLNIYAAKSDICRLVCLYFFGGIYLDTHISHNFNSDDYNLYRLFDKYKQFDCVIAKTRENIFNCSSLISKPRCKLLYDAIMQIIENLKGHYELEINAIEHINYDILELTGSSNFYKILEFFKINKVMTNEDITNSESFKKYNTAVFCCCDYLNYYTVNFSYNHCNNKHWSEMQKVNPLFIK
jgi:hypothetical protein